MTTKNVMESEMSMDDLVTKVNKHERMFNHHIGLPGDTDGEMPHPAASLSFAGLMTPEDKRTLRGASGVYMQMPTGTDVLTLSAGRYAITGSPNRPKEDSVTADNAIVYDVYHRIDNNVQIIVATVAYSGERFVYKSYNGENKYGWSHIYEETLLFSGYQSNGTIKLPYSVNDFRKIKFQYSVSNIRRSDEYEGSDKVKEYEFIVPDQTDKTDTWMASHQMMAHFSDEKTFIVDRNRRINFNGVGSANVESGSVTIERIYGIV